MQQGLVHGRDAIPFAIAPHAGLNRAHGLGLGINHQHGRGVARRAEQGLAHGRDAIPFAIAPHAALDQARDLCERVQACVDVRVFGVVRWTSLTSSALMNPASCSAIACVW